MSVLEAPFADGSKTIVVDEESEALYARSLIAGWLQKRKADGQKTSVELLAFSSPKSWYLNGPVPFTAQNLNIHDFYTLDINSPSINDCEKLDKLIKNIESKSMGFGNLSKRSLVIVDDLSSLVVFAGLAKASWFIEKLSALVPRMVCIYQRNFARHKVPSIETLGSVYIQLEKYNGIHLNNDFLYSAKIIVRKSGGSVSKESIVIRQNIETYEIKTEKASTQTNMKKQSIGIKDNDKVEASFRIDMSEREMEQKMKTPLPYTIDNNTVNTSKILYEPEDIDDLDEEDPDDDLCI